MLFTPLLALAVCASAAPAGTNSASTSLASTSSPATATPSSTTDSAIPSPTVAYASDDPNGSLLNQYQSGTPEPERGTTGASILGPQNIPLERESPDFFAPPSTDSGSV